MPDKRFAAIALTVLLAACQSFAGKSAEGIDENDLGDRTTYNFQDIVISIPLEDSMDSYENLHVVITAFINLKGADRKFSSSTSYASDLLSNVEPRIHAEVQNVLQVKAPYAWNDVYALKPVILAAANKVLASQYEKWKHKSEYTIELAITSFYFPLPNESWASRPRRHYAK